jgi:hypothetical protein
MTDSNDAQNGTRLNVADQHRKTSMCFPSETPLPSSMRSLSDFLSGHAACVNCHSRKVKCDTHKRGFPCSNCITSRRPHCRVHEKRKRTLHRPVDKPVPIRPQVQERSPPNAASIATATSPVESTLSPEISSPNQSVHVDSVSAAREPDRSVSNGTSLSS